MPSWGNSDGSNWNMPSMNWNNNSNGQNNSTNWSMPNMNFGNANNNNGGGFNNGTNWNMPSMNFSNGIGNNNKSTGSNWNMPSMNWGNGNNNGSNWSIPNFNWANNNQPFNFGNTVAPTANYAIPKTQVNNQYKAPIAPSPPQFIPRVSTPIQSQRQQQYKIPKTSVGFAPNKRTQVQTMPKQGIPQTNKVKAGMHAPMHIPMPAEVKGVILAPENQPK